MDVIQMGMMMGRRSEARLRKDAKATLAKHCMQECHTKAYHFRRPDGGSFYAYTLTWSPGTLTLSGDIGSLVLTHYHAMPTFRRAMSWAATSDYDYLLGKSNAQREFNVEGTVEFIVQNANEAPLDWILGTRKYRHPKADAAPDEVAAFKARYGKRSGGFLDLWRSYRKSSDEGEILDLWEGHPFIIAEKPDWRQRGERRFDDVYEYAECWAAWLRIWKHTRGRFFPYVHEDDAPHMVLSAAGRRELKFLIADEVGSPSDSAEFCRKIRFDDYFGDYKYAEQTVLQIEAIKHGCKMILASLPDDAQPEEAKVLAGVSHAAAL